MPDDRQIFAFSGVLREGPDGPDSLSLVDYAIGLARGEPPRRVCYVPTGVGDSAEAVDFYLSVFAGRPDVDLSVLKLFTQPSVPDVRSHLLGQDVILVEGGSVVNLMAVWRAHGLPEILRECWEAASSWPGRARAACAGTGAVPPTRSAISSRHLLTGSAWCRSATVSTTISLISRGVASTGT